MNYDPNTPSGSTPLGRLLQLLPHAVRSGSGWMARCPAHDDHNPSLSLREAEDGGALVYCFGGCSIDTVLAALGLESSALFAHESYPRKSRAGSGWLHPRDAAQSAAAGIGATVEMIYEYTEPDQILRFAVARMRKSDGKTFRPLHRRGDRWFVGRPQRLTPLFQLPAVLAATDVLLVEGEKCVLAAAAKKVVATTSAGGAKAAESTDWTTLRRKRVVIWPDNDDPGRQYAEKATLILRGIDSEMDIRVLSVPGLPEGGDIADWIEAQEERGLADDEITVLLRELIATAKPAPETNSTCSTYSTRLTPSSDDWPEPSSLPETPPPVAFPIEAGFPPGCERLRDYIAAVAHSYQVPVDLPALLAVAAFALASAKHYEVVAQPDWREILAVYVLIILPSGERKSAVFSVMIGPIQGWQALQASELAPDLNSHQNEVAVLKEKVRRARREAASPSPDDGDGDGESHDDESLDELSRELAEKMRAAPVPPSMIATEATTESIDDMLFENGERGMLASPEGDAIDVMLGRYGTGRPNFGLWLSGHSGDSTTIRRKGRTPRPLHRPALIVALTVQPVAVQDLIQSAQAEGRGILARFIYARPTPMVGYRELEPARVPMELTDWYGALLHELLDEPVPADPQPLYLTVEAKELLRDFRQQVELDLREGGALHDCQAWGSKLPGTILRLAGLFHIIGNKGRGNGSIEAATLKAAIAWASYLIDHQRRSTSTTTQDAVIAIARRILAWLRRQRVSGFDHNQCFNAVRSATVSQATDIDAALHLLEECNYIRSQPTPERPPGKRGRPRSTCYLAHPSLSNPGKATQNTCNTQNSAEGREGAA